MTTYLCEEDQQFLEPAGDLFDLKWKDTDG